MERSLGVLVLTLLVAANAVAQDLTIKGRVLLSEDSTVVTGASVRLRDRKEATIKGTTSGTDGRFSLRGEKDIISDLLITFLGTTPERIGIKGARGGELDLGDIYLHADDKTLSEVVVQGALKSIDREIVFPDPHFIKSSPNVLNLLQSLSLRGLNIDTSRRSANIRGKGIYWMINGVPKTFQDVLRLSPKEILRIEYSDIATIRLLDRDQGGSINIILKERTDGGGIHTSLSSALVVGCANADISGNYHSGKSDVTLAYSGNYRDYPRWTHDVTQTFNKPDVTIKREEDGYDSPFGYLENNIDLNYVYRPREADIFSLTWRSLIFNQGSDLRSSIRETGKESYYRRSVSRYKTFNTALDGYYKHLFADGEILEANIVGSGNFSNNNRDLTDTSNETIIKQISNPVRNRYYSILGEVTYTKSLHPSLNLSLGLQEKYSGADNYYFSTDKADRLDQNNTYLYGQLSGTLTKDLQYNFGTGLKVFYVDDTREKKTFVKNKSSLNLYYAPTQEWSFSLGSYYTPYLPSLSELTTITEQYDHLMYYSGNPFLKPGNGLNSRLTSSYRKGKISANLDLTYDYTFDPIYTEISYSRELDAFISKPQNGHYESKAGAKLNFRFNNLFDFLTILGAAGYNFFRNDVGSSTLRKGDFYWEVSALATYKDFTLAGYYIDQPATLYGLSYMKPGPGSGLTALWSKERLQLYAQILWLGIPYGDSYTNTVYSDAAPYQEHIIIPENGNMFVLGVVWDFSFGKKAKRFNRSLNNYDSDNSVIKVQK